MMTNLIKKLLYYYLLVNTAVYCVVINSPLDMVFYHMSIIYRLGMDYNTWFSLYQVSCVGAWMLVIYWDLSGKLDRLFG